MLRKRHRRRQRRQREASAPMRVGLGALLLAAGVSALSPGLLETKTPYPASVPLEVPGGCRLIHVSHVQRHGSRGLLSLKKLDAMDRILQHARAFRADRCTLSLLSLVLWQTLRMG